MLAVGFQTCSFNFHPKITAALQQNENTSLRCRFPPGKCFCMNGAGLLVQEVHQRSRFEFSRRKHQQPFSCPAVSSGLEDTQVSSSEFQEFSVTMCPTDKADSVKINVDVCGTRTQAVFDEIFSKMVADAQPIPGFRRVKGGKTPNIPKDVLLEILGASKVYKQVVNRVINSTISEYVQKEGLKVSKDVQVQQSFEDLEAVFEPGEAFRFEAILLHEK